MILWCHCSFVFCMSGISKLLVVRIFLFFFNLPGHAIYFYSAFSMWSLFVFVCFLVLGFVGCMYIFVFGLLLVLHCSHIYIILNEVSVVPLRCNL